MDLGDSQFLAYVIIERVILPYDQTEARKFEPQCRYIQYSHFYENIRCCVRIIVVENGDGDRSSKTVCI